MNRAVSLDLNGTLVEPVQVEKLEQNALIPWALGAFREGLEANPSELSETLSW